MVKNNSLNENIDAVKWFHSHNCDKSDKKLSFTYRDGGIGTAVYARCSCGKCCDVTDYDTW